MLAALVKESSSAIFCPAESALMQILVAKTNALLVDEGHDGDRFHESLTIPSMLGIVPPRSNRTIP